MKIAIEFFGHYRTFEQCADNIIENLINPIKKDNEVDIFIHTWNETDSSSAVWHNLNGVKRGTELREENISFLKEKLTPKKIMITPQVFISEDEYKAAEKRGHSSRGYYSALKNSTYSRMQVNNLKNEYEKENNIKYDLVIQTRLDVFYMKDVYFLQVANLPDINNKLFYAWTGVQDYYFNYPLYGPGATDILYFGTSDVIDKFSNLYNKIENIDFAKEKVIAIEPLLFKNIESQNIIPISFNFYIHRDCILLRTNEVRKHLKQITNYKKAYKNVIFSLLKLSLYASLLIILIFFDKKLKRRYKYMTKIQKYYNKYFSEIPLIPSDML